MLGLLLVWPLVHHGLVLRYDISPWNFAGWAMYCVPRKAIEVELIAVDGQRRVPVNADSLSPEARYRYDLYLYDREIIGRFASSEKLARAVFENQSGFNQLELVVTRHYLSFPDGMWTGEREVQHFQRQDLLPGP